MRSDGDAISLTKNTCYIQLDKITSTAGVIPNTLLGINCNANSGKIWINEATISNKNIAYNSAISYLHIVNAKGTTNTIVYRAYAGTIQLQNAGTCTGTVLNRYEAGGLIINPSGGQIGT